MSSEQKTTSHLVYTKLECPFDLESVLKITYSTDGLKQVLEFILDHLGEVKMVSGENAKLGSQLDERLKEVEAKLKDHGEAHQKLFAGHDDLCKNQEQLGEKEQKTSENVTIINTVEITKIWNAIQTLNGEKQATPDTFKYEPVAAPAFDLSTLDDMYAMKGPPDLTIKRIEDLEKQMKALAAAKIPTPTRQIKVIQKEPSSKAVSEKAVSEKEEETIPPQESIEMDTTAISDGRADLANRVARLEDSEELQNNRMDGMQDEIDALKKALDEVKKALADGLANMTSSQETAFTQAKVETTIVKETFDSSHLDKQIHSMGGLIDAKVGQEELRQMKQEMYKYIDRGDNNCKQYVEKVVEDLKHQIQQLRAEFEQHCAHNFAQLVGRVTAIEKKLVQLANQKSSKGPVVVAGNDDSAELKRLAELLRQLQNDLNKLRGDVENGFDSIYATLETKADLDTLKDLENRFMEQINDLVKVMAKKFADKIQNKKEHADMEKQIRNLYDLIMNRGMSSNEEEGMLTKKPFAGLACASCEKDLTNMYGRKVEYMPWSKLPMRDPSERIAKVGQGFSKMLSMIKPESMTRLDGSRNSPVNRFPSVIRESRDAYDAGDFRGATNMSGMKSQKTITVGERRPSSGQKSHQILMAARSANKLHN